MGVACGHIYDLLLADHLTFAVSPAVSKIFTPGKIDRGKYMARGQRDWSEDNFVVNRETRFVKIIIGCGCSCSDWKDLSRAGWPLRAVPRAHRFAVGSVDDTLTLHLHLLVEGYFVAPFIYYPL